MDVKAAVAVTAGKPLEVMTVQLEGPKAFEVLVEIKATGICHTDEFTLSGADPEGLLPASPGHAAARRPRRSLPGDPRTRGRRCRVRCRAGRHLGEEGRSRHSALHAGVPP